MKSLSGGIPEPPLVFHYQLQGEKLVLDFRAPPGWDKTKEMTIYATVDFKGWHESKAKRRGKYLYLQLEPKGPMMRMRRFEQRIPGL